MKTSIASAVMLLMVLSGLGLVCDQALAQSSGEMGGTVTDSTGAPMPNVTMTLVNTLTNQTRVAKTNEAGNYRFPFLTPGVYDLKAEMNGFKTAARNNNTLHVGDAARLDFKMEIGQVTQSLEVEASAPLLAAESTAMGTVVENKRIVELPLNGRNYLQMIALNPNVSAEQAVGGSQTQRQGGDRTLQSFSVAGQRLEFNRYTLDGVENTDVNFNTFIIRPSIEALQEFKVQTGVYSAEFGRATSQINVATRSGGNQYHGTLFEFLRNDTLDAKEWLKTGDKNPFRRNQFGYTFSGRILRDRLFFLSNMELMRDRRASELRANVPTADIRSGNLAGLGRNIFDPASRVFGTDAAGNIKALSATAFPGNTIPRSRWSPIAEKLLEFYPAATVPGSSIVSNYIRNDSRPLDQNQYTQRLDWNESQRSFWFGRYSWGDELSGQLGTFPGTNKNTVTNVRQLMLSNTRTFGTSVVNEFRFGYSHFRNEEITYNAYRRNVGAELGIQGLPDIGPSAWGTPQIGLGNGLSSFGEDPNAPYVNRNHIFQWLDNVSIVRGKHSIKIGGEMRRDRFNQFGNSHIRSVLSFSGYATFDPANRAPTGLAFADFLIGEVGVAQRAMGMANLQFRSLSMAFYAEDSYKIRPNLTLTYGLRYENTPPWTDKYRGIANLYFPTSGILDPANIPILTRAAGGAFYDGLSIHYDDSVPTQVGDDFMGRSLIRRDNNDFAPRVGIAYSPTERWTVRSGVGVFFAQDTGNPRWDMGRNLAGRSNYTMNQERPDSPLSDPWRGERTSGKCTGWTGLCVSQPTIFANFADRRTPYIFQYMFNVQRQVKNNILLEAGYLGNSGRKLEVMTNVNMPVLRTGVSDSRSQMQRRPWPMYNNIQEIGSMGLSNYNALSLKAQQRFSKGLTYMVGYTWSKAIDLVSALRVQTGDSLAQNPYNIRESRGLSQFHTGRRLVASFVYEIPAPFGGRSAILRNVLGGWQAGSIITLSDGNPVGVGSVGDPQNAGTSSRPDATGISPLFDHPTAERFWNLAAFNVTNPELNYRYGTTGRNVLFSPGYKNWDASLNKNFSITEGHTLQFRWESFNFANHPNWATPGRDPMTPATFGRVTAAKTMRQMQFALKYMF